MYTAGRNCAFRLHLLLHSIYRMLLQVLRGGFAVMRTGLTMAKVGRCPSLCLAEHLLAVFPRVFLRAYGRTVAFLKLRVEGIFRIQIHIVQHSGVIYRSLSLRMCVCVGTTTNNNKKGICQKTIVLFKP